jgi:hypothetical protein
MLNYKLDKKIDGSKLIQDIQELINKVSDKTNEYLLHIEIKKISYDDTTMILKLDHKI